MRREKVIYDVQVDEDAADDAKRLLAAMLSARAD